MPWTEPDFRRFLDEAAAQPSFAQCMDVMRAYADLGEAPANDELRAWCGALPGESWNQSLRTRKMWWTLRAWERDRESFWLRPRKRPDGRVGLPMEPTLHGWLVRWAKGGP